MGIIYHKFWGKAINTGSEPGTVPARVGVRDGSCFLLLEPSSHWLLFLPSHAPLFLCLSRSRLGEQNGSCSEHGTSPASHPKADWWVRLSWKLEAAFNGNQALSGTSEEDLKRSSLCPDIISLFLGETIACSHFNRIPEVSHSPVMWLKAGPGDTIMAHTPCLMSPCTQAGALG